MYLTPRNFNLGKPRITPRNFHGRGKLPNGLAGNLLLTKINGIYTQKVSTGEENSLMPLLDICSLLGPTGFIPRKCPWEKGTPWSPCPKTAFNNLTCNPPPPPPGHPRGFAIFFFLEGLFPTPEDTERDNNWENSHRREFHWGVFLISYRVYMFVLPVPVYSPDRFETETSGRFAFTWNCCEVSSRSEIHASVQLPG